MQSVFRKSFKKKKKSAKPTLQGLCTRTDVRFVHAPLTCPSRRCLLAPLPPLTALPSAHRLAHPEGSLPDLALLNPPASLEKPEGTLVAEPGEETPEGLSEKVEKGELGKDSEDEEDEDEDEEEETSGDPSAAQRRSESAGRRARERSTHLTKQICIWRVQ